MDKKQRESYRLLFKALLALQTEEECADFLEDLMTRKELADVSQRLLVAQMLSEQAVPLSSRPIRLIRRSFGSGVWTMKPLLSMRLRMPETVAWLRP